MGASIAELREMFASNLFFEHMGIRIVKFEEGLVELEIFCEPHLLNVNDTVHGGVYATLLDSVIGMTLRTIVRDPVVTMSLTVQFLQAVRSGKIVAKGKVLKTGYKTLFGEGEISDESGNLLAKGSGTFKVKRS